VLAEYERTSRSQFAIRKGALNGQVLSAADVKNLAELPSRETLIAMVAGALQSPVAQLAGLLNRMLANPPGRLLNDSFSTFTGLLEARAKQLEGA
jgi:large subunit ribosomal protein L10